MGSKEYFDPAVAYAQIDAEIEKEEKKAKRKTLVQAIKYACCTISAGVIQLVSFTILQAVIPASGQTIHFIVEDMDLVTFLATTIALVLSILWNFTLNRKFTFKAAGNVARAMILAFLFYVPFYPFQTWYVYTVKQELIAALGEDLAGILAEGTVMLINGVLEFCWQKFFIYRKTADTAPDKHEVGTIGEFGEIAVEKPEIGAAQLLDLMKAGKDITADNKKLKKELKALEQA